MKKKLFFVLIAVFLILPSITFASSTTTIVNQTLPYSNVDTIEKILTYINTNYPTYIYSKYNINHTLYTGVHYWTIAFFDDAQFSYQNGANEKVYQADKIFRFNITSNTSNFTLVKMEYDGTSYPVMGIQTTPSSTNTSDYTKFSNVINDGIDRSFPSYSMYITATPQDAPSDIIPPSNPTLTAIVTGFNQAEVSILYDSDIDVISKEYKIGDGAWTAYISSFTVTSECIVYARSSDSSGNISNSDISLDSSFFLEPPVVHEPVTQAVEDNLGQVVEIVVQVAVLVISSLIFITGLLVLLRVLLIYLKGYLKV